jgi:hypothetical protein
MSFTTEIPAINQPKQSYRANVVKLLLMGPANAGKTVIGKKLEETFNFIGGKSPSDRWGMKVASFI